MARLVANTAKMEHGEWLQLRKEGIGGSDASAVVGVSKYSSPVMVYMDKLGEYEPEKRDHVKEAASWGNIHEPTIRKVFAERENAKREEKGLPPLRVVHRKAIFAHDEHDFIRTNLDGIVYDPELGQGVFEAKTAHYMLRNEWDGEDVPNAYFIQVQHNMAVMEMNYAWLAVLIGGNQFKYYFIPRDQEFIDHLIQLEVAFWSNHILQRIPPQMSGSDAEKDMMKDLYPQSENREGEIVSLPISCIELAEKVDAYKQLVVEMKEEQTKYENEIKAIMGTTEIAFAGSHKITWKTASNGNRAMRIKLDSQDDRNKFYEKMRSVAIKEIKEIEKERKEIEKVATAQRKADEKARKELEKSIDAELKAARKELKRINAEFKKMSEVGISPTDEEIGALMDINTKIEQLEMSI